MRVTDAMLERGVNAFVDAQPECALRHGSRAVMRAILEAALANVPEPSRLDNVDDFASDLVCKYHGMDRGYGKYQELKSKMVEALLFVARMRDEKAAP